MVKFEYFNVNILVPSGSASVNYYFWTKLEVGTEY